MQTRESLVSVLVAAESELGEPPDPDDIEAISDTPPIDAFLSYFGTWNNAIRNADLDPNGDIETRHPQLS